MSVAPGSDTYTMLDVRGTNRPLRFYHLDPEHKDNAEAYVRFSDAHNVAVFGFKGEDDKASSTKVPELWISDSSQISVFGIGGFMVPGVDGGSALFRIDNSSDFRLVSVMDRLAASSQAGHTTVVRENPSGGETVEILPLDRPILYAREASNWSTVPAPRHSL